MALTTTLLLAATLGVTSGAAADELEWTIAPYVWLADTGLDVTINDDPVLGTTVPFRDLVDKLDTAIMGHAEVRGRQFGGFVDIFYIKLSDQRIRPVGPRGPILGELVVDSDLKLEFYELGGLYRIARPGPGRAAFDVLLGVRRIESDAGLVITLPGPGAGQITRGTDVSETDVFGGVRVIGRFNDRWGYKARVDYGGGGSDGTLNLFASVGYTFGQTGLFGVDVGYRYMQLKLSQSRADDSRTRTETTLSGPLVGFIFSF